jgi:hypothetical protein
VRLDGACGVEWGALISCLTDPAVVHECKNNKPNTSSCIEEALTFAACDQNGGNAGFAMQKR